MSTDHPV